MEEDRYYVDSAYSKGPHVIANVLITPDGTELVSKYRHDYVEYVDDNKKWYFVDGGTDYFRYGEDPESPAAKKQITNESPFSEIRQYFYWGTYGKNGDEPLQWKALKDLNTDHIKAILETQKQLPEWRKNIFKAELTWRESNNNK